MDLAENRAEVAKLIAQPAYVNAPESVIRMSMTGQFQYGVDETPEAHPDFNVFNRYAANYPWRSHAKWFIAQMYRWGQIDRAMDIAKAAAEVYRPDIYRDAAAAIGRRAPESEDKTEGTHTEAWTMEDANGGIEMGPDMFFDKHVFDPDQLIDYLGKIPLNNLSVDLETLTKLNRRQGA